jgi:hypothetical protein
VLFFKVNVTWADFVAFTFTRHFSNHGYILFKLVRRLCVAIAGSSCVVRTENVAVVLSAVVGKSAVRIE